MKKGFTLLELLIVIGILAILSAVTILVINPAELLRKSRDTQRISDLGSINSAIAFYLTNASTYTFGSAVNSYSHTSTVQCGMNGAVGRMSIYCCFDCMFIYDICL
ncbi:MAG: type II secretion system protein [Candidatus Parcubacteria bacterium]|nr:type II secretion system protein [Candidatus Parcubacteria bacterium]